MSAPATVVVCTHDRPDYLRTCLDSLGAQSAALPVLVVDSASPPEAATRIAALARAAGARLLRLDRPGLSRARNAALAAVETGWIAFLDDDARAEPGWAVALAEAIATLPDSAAGLGGRILPLWEAPCPDWWPPELVPALTVLEWDRPGRLGDGELPAHVEPYGANMAFRTASLRDLGGFPESLGRVGTRLLSAEEAWVIRRLLRNGHSVHYHPALAVRHSIQAVRLSRDWLLARQYWSGLSEAVMAGSLGEAAAVRRKAFRMAALLALRTPLLAVRRNGVEGMRLRCSLRFAMGYLRGAAGLAWSWYEVGRGCPPAGSGALPARP
ncbi:Glycosyltransferase family 2 protein [Rhodovastum atsumiense]|uniref:Glycosyltransferase family 2 protein n=1 Tax=Rhodovastum atsumiense TaxID=504468 RepID=A0A5M6J248_9PROT|nr:glycosyltransferase family A protein [Rhodovastum atsumiense]KAA5614309.1 glycosyltransferase family 2 protein [Rhodovastum atsumiense]CAH2604770.1 Glycosyltransferase family 2 protein [Rhodovastum atsumiense]